MRFILAIAIVLTTTLLTGEPTTVYKLTPQHNRYEIGITCTNGADPTGSMMPDGMLIISCGK